MSSFLSGTDDGATPSAVQPRSWNITPINGAAAAPAPPPAPPGSQLLRYRADAVVSAGGLVSLAADLSGNGLDATAAGAARPLVVGAAINGKPALSFDGISQILTIPPIDFTGITGFTAVFVMNVVRGSKNALTFTSWSIFYEDLSGLNQQIFGIFDGGSVARSPVIGSFGSWLELEIVMTGNNTVPDFYQGLVPQAGNAALQMMSGAPSTPNYLGGFTPASFLFEGLIAECICYARALSAAERVQLLDYISNRYAI